MVASMKDVYVCLMCCSARSCARLLRLRAFLLTTLVRVHERVHSSLQPYGTNNFVAKPAHAYFVLHPSVLVIIAGACCVLCVHVLILYVLKETCSD